MPKVRIIKWTYHYWMTKNKSTPHWEQEALLDAHLTFFINIFFALQGGNSTTVNRLIFYTRNLNLFTQLPVPGFIP